MNLKDLTQQLVGIDLSDEQITKFEKYQQLLLEWNQQINLTAITEPEGVQVRHFLDSLSLLKFVAVKPNMHLIDVGTGAGFPGLPLHIVKPSLNTTLLDSTKKKLKFLDHVITELDLSQINTFHARAEDGAHDKSLREKFDLVTARAVARLPVLLEYTLPYVALHGYFIAMKGTTVYDEIEDSSNALKVLGGVVQAVHEMNLPGVDASHYLVVIEKIQSTPSLYPRKAGLPSKSPL